MKKSLVLISLVAAAFALASCNKEEAPVADLKFNLTVSSIDGTKAVKTAWASGDIINVWFDDAWSATPQVRMTYDGSIWTPIALDTDLATKLLASGGKLYAFYEGHNDLSKWSFDSNHYYPSGGYGRRQMPLVVAANAISYTYSGGTISANLDTWTYITEVQIVITGLDSAKAANYSLALSNGGYGLLRANCLYRESANIGYSEDSYAGYTGGVPNADGVAFYFIQGGNMTSFADYTITLEDYGTDPATVYQCTKPKATSWTKGSFKGIKIAFSDFTPAS